MILKNAPVSYSTGALNQQKSKKNKEQ